MPVVLSNDCIPVDGVPTLACPCRVTCLHYEVGLYIVEQHVVIILQPAQHKHISICGHQGVFELGCEATASHLQSLRKFLLVIGHSSVNKSTTRSPLLVSSMTAMAAFCQSPDRCLRSGA